MGGVLGSSDKVAPSASEEYSKYRSRSTSDDKMEPARTKNRTTTDVCFLLVFTTFLIGLLCFLGYCIFYGDIRRIVNGYDNCGRICGKQETLMNLNKSLDECYRTTPNALGKYHLILRKDNSAKFDRLCVSNCSNYEGYKAILNRCLPFHNQTTIGKFFSKTGLKDFFAEVSEDFNLCWKEFCLMCAISLVFSLVILVLFRYLVGYVVWIVLIGVMVACTLATVILWVLWKNADPTNINVDPDIEARKKSTYLIFAIIATVVTVVVLLVIIVMRKRIQLVVQLFEEAGKAIAAMPGLLFEPLLTFACLAMVIFLFFYFCLWIESAGHLTEKRANVFSYRKNGWIKFTRWYNFFGLLWMVQYIIGCQHMVIAGAVSQWYFTREKSRLDSPISNSMYLLSRYHLGSVAIGSFLIALVQLLRAILTALEKRLRAKDNDCVRCAWKCCQCCLYCFENFLKYWTRNAYIEIAIYGHNFCEAGKQAFKQLASNALRVAAINSVGDFVLFLGKVLVVVATVLIGIEMLKVKEGLQHLWVPVTLAGLFAYFISHCFMTVYEMTIDTIFLCFCEDCEKNDGGANPYYMSRGLMEFVENSKKMLEFEAAPDNKETGEA